MKELINGMKILHKAIIDKLSNTSYVFITTEDYTTNMKNNGPLDWWLEIFPIVKLYKSYNNYDSYIVLKLTNNHVLCGSLQSPSLILWPIKNLNLKTIETMINIIEE